MKAQMESTDQVVKMPGGQRARVWEGVSENGVPFVAYVCLVQVYKDADAAEFDKALSEHKLANKMTLEAIDQRFII